MSFQCQHWHWPRFLGRYAHLHLSDLFVTSHRDNFLHIQHIEGSDFSILEVHSYSRCFQITKIHLPLFLQTHPICCGRYIFHMEEVQNLELLSVCGVSSTSGRGDSRHGTSGSSASPRQSGTNDLEGNLVPPHMACGSQYEPLSGSVGTRGAFPDEVGGASDIAAAR